MSEIVLQEGALRYETDVVEVQSYTPQPDPRWRSTDSVGHEHRAVDGYYPTLEWVVTGEDGCGDPECCGETWETGEYRCAECGEPVKPGTRVPTSPTVIVTGRRWYLDDEPISEERASEIVESMRAHHEAEQAEKFSHAEGIKGLSF